MDAQTNNYLHYYSSQSGGSGLHVFEGARRGQFGSGLGDILRGIFRSVLPIAAHSAKTLLPIATKSATHGANTYLDEVFKAKSDGNSWKDSALNAIQSTAHHLVDDVGKRIKRSVRQKGSGRRNRRKGNVGRRRRRRSRRKKKTVVKGTPTLRGRKRRKRKSYKSSGNAAKRIKFLNF